MIGVPFTILLVALLPILTYIFVILDLPFEIDRIFLTVSTFIFSIFTGFFISRQASRFNRVRETVTRFDGVISSIYRSSGHISKALQVDVARVVSAHYNRILETGKWEINFIQKSDTISSLHELLNKHVVEKEVTKLSNQAIGSIIKGLSACQSIRKQMVALYEERIPKEQWLLIFFFVSILIFTVSAIPSSGLVFQSLLKAAFIISVLSVVFILYKLNQLAYSEKIMGEHSARDVLGIIDGSK